MLATIVAIGIGVSGAIAAAPPPAEAASYGYGQWLSGFWHGSFTEPGSGFLYCLDENRAQPIGVATTYQGIQTSISAAGGVNDLSGNVLAGINWLISTHGQTTNNAVARAVNDAIWIVASNYSTVDALSNQFAAQIRAYVAPASGGTGTMSMVFGVDTANNYFGDLTITSMSMFDQGARHLYVGRGSISVEVYDAKKADSEPVFNSEYTCEFPPGRPVESSEMPIAKFRLGFLRRMATDLAWKFSDHLVEETYGRNDF